MKKKTQKQMVWSFPKELYIYFTTVCYKVINRKPSSANSGGKGYYYKWDGEANTNAGSRSLDNTIVKKWSI